MSQQSRGQKQRRKIRRAKLRASEAGATLPDSSASLPAVPSSVLTGALRAANVAISGGPLDETGHTWPIVLVQAGPAKLKLREGGPQGYISPEAIMAACAAGVFEGSDSYEDHPPLDEAATLPERSVRKKLGRVSQVRWDPAAGPMGAAVGVWKTWDDLYAARLLRAWKLQTGPPFEFSIYGPVDYEQRDVNGSTYDVVTTIHAASVDLVTAGAAGGRFLTQLAASLRAAADGGKGSSMIPWKQFLKQKPGLAKQLIQAGSFKDVQALLTELEIETDAEFVASLVTAREEHAAAVIDGAGDKPAAEAEADAVAEEAAEPAETGELTASVRAALAELRAEKLELAIEKKLSGSEFDEADRKLLEPQLRAAATPAKMDAALDAYRAFLATKFNPQFPTGTGTVRAAAAEVTQDERDTFNTALDGFFSGTSQKGPNGTKVARFSTLTEAIMHFPRHKHIRGVSGADIGSYLAGSYCARYINPDIHPETRGESGPYVIRGDKYVPLRASATTSTFGEVFADRAHKSFMLEYQAYANTEELEKLFSETREVDDFKAHRFIQIGGYANMPSVSEAGTYQPLVTPADREESGTLVKYGGVEDVTFEALRDPDGAKLAMLPRAMGAAMGRTYREECLNSFTTSEPTMSDGNPLYTSHSNNGTQALTLTELEVVRVAMHKQTQAGSSKRLGTINSPRYLFVPPDLYALASRILGPTDAYRTSVSNAGTDTTLDARYFATTQNIQIVELTHHTDANNWYVMADPQKIPTLARLQLRGVPQPEFFQQFDPNAGSMFDADKGKWKVRFFWDFVVLDWVGFYEEIVA